MTLLSARWTVVAPDLPGHGRTRLGAKDRSGLAHMTADCTAMIAERFGTPQVVVGHSAGGAIALETDAVWPDAKRILINPALAPFDGAAGFVFPRLARALKSAPFAVGALSQSFSKEARIRALLQQTGSPVTDEAVTRYRHLAAQKAHIAGTLSMMAAWDVVPLRNRLPQYAALVLFAIGTGDKTVSPDIAKLEAGRMPNARLREFDGGHLLHEEQPEAVADLIEAFAG